MTHATQAKFDVLDVFDTSHELAPHAGEPVRTAGAPLDNAALAVLLLHGRGAGPEDVLSLADAYGLPGVCYVAPAAANSTWYPQAFSAGDKMNGAHVESAHTVIESVFSTLARHGFAPERCAMGGFSQGACLTLTHAMAYPRRYGLLFAYTGALIGNFKKGFAPHGTLDGTPVEISGGDQDAHVPWYQMKFAGEVLEGMGAEVSLDQHPGLPHTICRDQIARTRERLQSLMASKTP